MAKQRIAYTDHFAAVMNTLTSSGVLVGAYDAAGKGNLMTIGWGAIGSIWGLPAWIILVRPSRYTYRCIEHSGCFTVNVPTADMHMACAVCGSTSGRTRDKFADCKLTDEKAQTVLAPAVAEAAIIYECQVVHRNDVQPERLDGEIISGAYTAGDFHRVYYGKILAVRAEADAGGRLLSV